MFILRNAFTSATEIVTLVFLVAGLHYEIKILSVETVQPEKIVTDDLVVTSLACHNFTHLNAQVFKEFQFSHFSLFSRFFHVTTGGAQFRALTPRPLPQPQPRPHPQLASRF